jgi:hypothetical protein
MLSVRVALGGGAALLASAGCPNRCAGTDCQTSLTSTLNDMIAEGSGGTYSGGKGILVRSPDFFSANPPTVVPATFWVNDIIAPSQLYPGSGAGGGSPWCPNNGWDGYYNVDACSEGPWDYAQMAAVVGTGMNQMMKDYDKLQTPDWGWGVFYPTDSNAADQRCRNLASEGGWDCPGYFVPYDSSPQQDASSKGAGYYEPGNPYAEGGGGGAGCHWNKDAHGGGVPVIDQQDAVDTNTNANLVQDRDCQCNYDLKGNYWYDWMDQLLNYGGTGNSGKPFDQQANVWFKNGLMPSWGMDSAICWVNNVYDLIGLQNAIYVKRAAWNNGQIPEIDYTSTNPQDMRGYWGWNEVPVRGLSSGSGAGIDDPLLWDAVMIKLPAALCNTDAGDPEDGGADSMCCLHPEAQSQLESDLDTWVEKEKKLVPGAANAANRPGSSVVIAREWMTWNANVPEWRRWFFCEDWTSPSGKYTIVYDQANDGCYLEQNF